MPLVDYSDSESSDSSIQRGDRLKDKGSHGQKRKRTFETDSTLPPLPDSFHDLYASTSRVSNQDDPTLHAGRQRLTPHVEGNWPTHVYTEWHPSTEQSSRLNGLLTTVNQVPASEVQQVHSLLRSELGAELPLHISLSRSITLLARQRQTFIDAFHSAIGKSDLFPFEVSITGLGWEANYEKTRWFLVMRLEDAPQNELNRILRISNDIVKSFGQLPLYEDLQVDPPQKRRAGARTQKGDTLASSSSSSPNRVPMASVSIITSSSFHVSIGWTLKAPSQSLVKRLETIGDDVTNVAVTINAVKLKIGNGITAIRLASNIDTLNKIIEK